MPSGPPSRNAGSIRYKRLRGGLLSLGVLVILGIACFSAYDAWRSYRSAVTSSGHELTNLVNAFAGQTAWSLQTVDLLLRDTARWYRNDSGAIPPAQRSAALERRTAGVQQVRDIMIVDAQGNQLYSSRSSAPPIHQVADRSYFIAQRDGTAKGLFVSEPLVTRSEGRAAIEVSRRLDDQNGRFAGVVSAVLDLDDLQRLFQAVDLGTNGSIQLLRDDGTLLAGNPPAPAAVGKRFPTLLAVGAHGVSRVVNPLNRRTDFLAVSRVQATPLTVAVMRDEAAALQPWRAETLGVAVRTLLLMLLAAFTLLALGHQLRRVEASEQALRESEERYALAMEGANEGHWDWDVGAERLYVSPRMKLLYGLDADVPINTRRDWLARFVIHQDDQARFDAALSEHFRGLTSWYDCEYRVRQPDGDWRWLHARGHVLRDAVGKPQRFVGSTTDVTAQRVAQLEKEKLEAQLRQSQKMEAVGTLAGGIAHDFNNILGAILGYGELAHQHSSEGSSMRRYLDNVMHAAERAQMLVARILGFSRSGLGDRAPVNVRFVIEETLELLEASLPAGIRLESSIDAADAAVIGDATYLHQVAMNLCTNAIQAMERGGVLGVFLDKVEVSAGRTLSRGALRAGEYVRLSVSDTGVGIPPPVLERIFDPFFTTKGVGQGTGLGLSMVLGIVSDLRGAIDVTTQPGEGTRFEIWLPISAETPVPAVASDAALPRGNGETVMIVDDEPALVALAEELTARLGYEPVGFDSSTAALAAFRAKPQRFDALLTDEAMPELVGTELASEIRRMRPAVPIILMSGYSGVQLTTRAAEIGIDEVLRKPLHQRDLAESLARVLGASH